jgi:hypothetical protein
MQGTDWLNLKTIQLLRLERKNSNKKWTAKRKAVETGYLKLNWKANEITKKWLP